MTVITITAVSVTIVLSLILSGISSNRDSATLINLSLARNYANACIEEALENIYLDKGYSGILNMTFDNGECEVITNRHSDNSFTLNSTGLSQQSTKSFEVIINQTSPQIVISSWK